MKYLEISALAKNLAATLHTLNILVPTSQNSAQDLN